MGSGRLEAFSDGVLAIIITIMVLEMKVPHGSSPSLETLKPMLPVFISYLLSFIYVGLYWNNHHHLMQTVKQVNGKVLWANTHLLFWLSLVPFTTAWMGENHFATWPVALYGFVLMMAAIAYYMLAHCLTSLHGEDATITKAIGKDVKGIVSVVLYAVGIGLAFVNNWIGFAFFVVVAGIWIIPDKRIEKKLDEEPQP